jgi:uncharacterized protein YhaN
MDEHTKRVNELEDEVKQLQRRLDEARRERDELQALVAEQRDWIEDTETLSEDWKAAFEMVRGEDGAWHWAEWLKQCDGWQEAYLELRKKWNTFVPEYNAAVARKCRNFGRPLAAGEGQRVDVLKRRKAGESLRSIADNTNLSLRTVRTIVDKADRLDRATLARLERIAPDRIAEAYASVGRKTRKYLPARMTALQESAAKLAKRAKGLR